jgi:hypothetical protein
MVRCSNWIILPGARFASTFKAPSVGGAAAVGEENRTDRIMIRRRGGKIGRFMMLAQLGIVLKYSSTHVSKSDKISDI